ncbi:MAG: response regulator [Planctomycetota bacterium]|jgi:CheY-like chemotaxis protein
MADTPQNPPGSSAGGGPSQSAGVETFLQLLGRIIRLYKLYPSTHPFVRQGLDEALKAYEQALGKSGRVTVGRVDDRILVNDEPLPKVSPQVADLVKLLQARNVASIELEPGAEPDEILSFARLVASREGESPPDELRYKSLDGLPHIRVNEVAYKKVGADEHVVSKEAQPGAAAGGSTVEGQLVRVLLQHGSVGKAADQLIGHLLDGDRQGLGRAIQKAWEPASAGAAEEGGGNLALRMLERAALKTLKEGAGFPEVQDRIAEITADFPPELISALSGGAKGREAPAQIARYFNLHSRAEILAASLQRELPMATLEESIDALRREGEDALPLLEGAAISLRLKRLPLRDAAPYVLDLTELERRRRRREVEQAKRPEERTSRFEMQQAPLVLVADTAQYHEFYRTTLEETAYRSTFTADGKDALEAIVRETPALVILDFKLTGIHGLDLVRRLRRRNVTPPLLIVTGQTAMTQEFEVKTYPNHRVLKKPPNRKAIVRAIQEIQGTKEGEGEDEGEETQALPSGLLKYLEKSSLTTDVQVKGFDFGTHLHFGPGSEALVADAFHLQGGRRGILLAGCSGADEDAVLLLTLFQSAVRIVSPWTSTGKAALIQTAGLLGTDGINRIPLVCQTVVVEAKTGKVTLCTAGAPPPLRFLSAKKKVRKVGAGGIAVGRLLRGGLGRVLEEEGVNLKPGDLLVLTNWAVLNASNAQGVRFGPESVGGLLLTAENSSPATTAGRIGQGVRRHMGKAPMAASGVVAVRKS